MSMPMIQQYATVLNFGSAPCSRDEPATARIGQVGTRLESLAHPIKRIGAVEDWQDGNDLYNKNRLEGVGSRYGMTKLNTETEALAAGHAYFRTVAPVYAFFALGLALYFASQGAGRMLWPVAGSVLRMVIAVGAALALGETAGLGLDGVFLGIATGMFAYGVFTALAVGLTRSR